MLHKHRIVPGHMGGKYTANNVVMLTIEEHAEAHRKLFEEYNRWQDYVAWKSLSGQIGKDEIIKLVISLANKGRPTWNKGLKVPQKEETKEKLRIKLKGNKNGIGNKGWSGKIRSEETKKKIGEKLKGKKKPPRTKEHIMKIADSRRGKPWSENRRNAQNRRSTIL